MAVLAGFANLSVHDIPEKRNSFEKFKF